MTDTKFRHEFKYIIDRAQAAELQMRLSTIMPRDSHARPDGIYNIRSLYYDDYYDRCLYENINGSDPREKFRIRLYNGSTDRISLECKRKERGKTLKTASLVTRELTEELMGDGRGFTVDPEENELIARFKRSITDIRLHPAVIVEYDRIPYVYREGNVRVTFDFDLSSSPEVDKFLTGGYGKRPVMPYNQLLLEVKFDEFLPDFIYRTLQLESLQQTAYSKYYLCRKYHL